MSFILHSLIAMAIGFGLDLLIGDPHTGIHPMIWIGKFIGLLDEKIRNSAAKDKNTQLACGTMLVVIVLLVCTGIPAAILGALYFLSPVLGVIVEGIMCYFLLATKCLKTESMKVKQALDKEGLEAGRKAVSMIVGRDTENLTEEGVIKATVETVAENTSDGVIAPLFFMAIGGATLGFLYKAVNTMDSMIGYKNDKYMHFGTAAAILDDIVNFIPARIAAIGMIIGAHMGGFNGAGAIRIFKRDRYNHASPNSAQTESVMAGALDVQLAGDAVYFGVLHKKKTIGDDIRKVEREDITRSNTLLYRTAFLCFGAFALVKLIIFFAIFSIFTMSAMSSLLWLWFY